MASRVEEGAKGGGDRNSSIVHITLIQHNAVGKTPTLSTPLHPRLYNTFFMAWKYPGHNALSNNALCRGITFR